MNPAKTTSKQRTTIYLPEELRWRLKKVMADRHVESDTKAIEEAVQDWIKGRRIGPQARVDHKNPWLDALAFVLASGDLDAISAVQQNIVLFYKYVGGNAEDLPPVSEPGRPFQTAAARPQANKKRA
jgi:hypothetical protein